MLPTTHLSAALGASHKPVYIHHTTKVLKLITYGDVFCKALKLVNIFVKLEIT